MKNSIVILFFFALGCVILYSGLNNLMMADRAKSWSTTEGNVKSSKCSYFHVMNEGSTYIALINYSYTVAGKSYKAERVAFGYKGSWYKKANQKIADVLSSAGTVLVRYDPVKPANAVLSCGMNGSIAKTMFNGICLLLMTAIISLRVFGSGSNTGTLAASLSRNGLKFVVQGFGGIVLLALIWIAIAALLGTIVDCGILDTLVTG